jgi:TPR repeat protein
MHRQRITLIGLALLGMGVCFVPWGREPVLGPIKGTGLLQLLAIAFGLSILVTSFLGSLAKSLKGVASTLAALATLFLLVAGVTRIVLLGYYWTPTFAEDDPRAKDFYEKACAAGRIKACLLLGTCYWTGTCGESKDVARAVELYEKACDASEISACGQLGVCYELGGCGVARSGSKAVAMYEKACMGGEMDMCNNLGVCYHRGECGVFRDSKRARVLYGKACDGGYSGACHNLSLIKE